MHLVEWTSAAARKMGSGDPSAWSLVGANVMVAAATIVTGTSARELVLVYGVQTLLICVCGAVRFALMRHRRKRDFHDDAPPAAEPLATRLKAGFTFLMFWMILLAGPAAGTFWNAQTQRLEAIPIDGPVFMLCVAAFVAHHGYSLVRNLRADAAASSGDRDLLFVIPFFRVFPMGIISAVAVAAGVDANAFAIVFYVAMKSVADLISHNLEHQLLRARGS